MRKTTERLNFTKKALDSLTAPQTRATYYDTQVRGLGLLVQPSGHKAFFWLRKVQGYPTWKTIGAFPDLSIENARAKAQEYNSSIAKWKADDYEGPAPLERRGSPTLGDILDDYIERHLRANAKNPGRAIKHTRWQFDRYLASWRDRKLTSIRREHVRDLHSKIGSRKAKAGPGEKNGHYSANRVVALVRILFNWAIKTEKWQGENPGRGIKRFFETKRTRFTQPDELPRLFQALRSETNLDLRDFVFLAMFTGARRSNILAMRWDQLDLVRGMWTIPEPKNRVPYVVPLIPEAVHILRARRLRTTSEWVFPSASKSGHVMDVKRAWRKFLKRAKITDLRIHDLRRTLGSWQAGAGISLPIIGKTLGHQSSAATQVYARLHLDPVRDAITQATRAMLSAGKVTRRKLLEAPRA